MKKHKNITKISFKHKDNSKKTVIDIEPDHGHVKSFLLDDSDMIQLEKTVALYNRNFVKK